MNLEDKLICKLRKLKENFMLEINADKIVQLLSKNNLRQGKNFKILTRYKEEAKVSEKIQRKHYTDINQFTDLMGIKIVLVDPKHIYKVNDILNNSFELKEINDYIHHPKEDGYKSLHVNYEIDNEQFEIQIKDIIMDLKQEASHDNIYKNNNLPEELKNQFSKEIYSLIDKYYEGKSISLNETLSPELNRIISFSIVKNILMKQYENQFPGIKYISNATVKAINDLNVNHGSVLTIKEIKKLYKAAGKKVELSTSKENIQEFKLLENIVGDLKQAQRTVKQHKVHEKVNQICKSKDIEI